MGSFNPFEADAVRYDSHHGRPESYWNERNALVAAVLAAGKSAPSLDENNGLAYRDWLGTEAGAVYRAADEALKKFDAANGGTPIL